MKISCQSCQAKYTIADEKVLGKIVKIRCKKCGATIVINGNETGAGTASTGNSNAEAQAFDYAGGATGDQWTVNVADGDQRTMTLDEIVGAFKSGTINDETYCWKDGMADWLPIREIAELQSAVGGGGGGGMSPDATHQDQAAASYGGAPAPAPHEEEPTAAGYSGYGGAPATNGNGNGAALFGGGMAAAAPEPAPAARRQGGRAGGGMDLFGGVAQAGAEDDVMTSAPAGMPQASDEPGKLTGQRNENSVLFSLSALTQNAPKEEAPQAPGEGSGLIDIRALSASMGDKNEVKRNHADDIMNLGGGGAFSAALAAPVLAPPSDLGGGGMLDLGAPQKDNTKLILGGIVGAGALIAIAIVLVFVMKKPEAPPVATPMATDTATAAQAPGAATVATSDTTPAPAATDTAGGAAAPGTGQAPAAAAPDKHAGGHHATGGGGGGGGGASADNTPSAPAKAYTPPPAPAGGGGGSLDDALRKSVGGGAGPAAPAAAPQSSAPFDRGAAAAALGSINVASCRKPDGPTGSGHVSVTFASSGSVSSAVVDRPPFAGTAVGGCVAGKFRGAHIPAFGGSPVTVGKSFIIE